MTWAVPWNSMELKFRQFRWHERFHGIPWNSVELGTRQFRWHDQFHGIPWNLEGANFDDTSSSMEFGVRQFRWHEQFHGILWKFKCANFDDTSSFMEFHGIPWNLKCANFAATSDSRKLECAHFDDTSSSMEFHGVRQFRWHPQFHGIPWNSMELGVRQSRWHKQFHGTCSAPISLTRAVPWNSMEFQGTSSAAISMTRAFPWNSMELLVSVPWNSMEPIVCYLMEPLVSSIHWVLKWDGIPWNLNFQILMKIIFNYAGWINFRKLINTLNLFAISFTNWCFIINICIIPYAFPALLITYQNIIQNLFSMLIETYFDQKVPWNFLQISMELFEQHLNNTFGSMEFHGIPWNFVQIQSSMECFPYSRVPWNSMEFRGTFNFPPKRSMEFHGPFLKFHGIP